jgi:hypothetical protein
MKKAKRVLAALTAVALLLGLAACGAPKQETVLRKLKPYLPEGAWGNFPEFEERAVDGGTLYYWHKPVEGSGGDTAQKIEYVFGEQGLAHYAYQDYAFPLPAPAAPLTMDGAARMAQGFAREFISGGKEMDLLNVPDASPHIYDPGVVGSWVGSCGGVT